MTVMYEEWYRAHRLTAEVYNDFAFVHVWPNDGWPNDGKDLDVYFDVSAKSDHWWCRYPSFPTALARARSNVDRHIAHTEAVLAIGTHYKLIADAQREVDTIAPGT